jgi:hypothetical protein
VGLAHPQVSQKDEEQQFVCEIWVGFEMDLIVHYKNKRA